MKGDQDHTVFALYSRLDPDPDRVRKGLDLAIASFDKLGLKPTKMGTNYDKGVIGFRASERKLRSMGFSEDSHFSLYVLPPEASSHWQGYWAHVFLHSHQQLAVVVDFESRLVGFESSAFHALVADYCSLARPLYGIGYRRAFSQGPANFAYGLGRDDPPPAQWVDAEKNGYIEKGFIRGVFPWNCLSPVHLDRRVGKQTFAQWVEADSSRGVLKPFLQDLTVWEVREENIPALRAELLATDIVFDYIRHFHKPVTQYCDLINRGAITRQDAVNEFFRTMGLVPAGAFKPLPPPPPPEPAAASDVLRSILQGLGVESSAEVEIRHVEKPGQTRTLSDQETAEILDKAKRKKPKR